MSFITMLLSKYWNALVYHYVHRNILLMNCSTHLIFRKQEMSRQTSNFFVHSWKRFYCHDINFISKRIYSLWHFINGCGCNLAITSKRCNKTRQKGFQIIKCHIWQTLSEKVLNNVRHFYIKCKQWFQQYILGLHFIAQ